MEITFEDITVLSDDGEVRVDLEWIGEGLDGDYDDSDDSTDKPLLRYSLFRRFHDNMKSEDIAYVCDGDAYEDGEWMAVLDGSYCTQLVATEPREKLEEAAKFILSHVEDDVRSLKRNKRLFEELSWIGVIGGEVACDYSFLHEIVPRRS